MSSETKPTKRKLTITDLVKTERRPKKDGSGEFVIHRVKVRSEKGEFEAKLLFSEPVLGAEKEYEIEKGKFGNEWEIREVKQSSDKKPWTGGRSFGSPAPSHGQEIHAMALRCATDMFLAGKLGYHEIGDWAAMTANKVFIGYSKSTNSNSTTK